VVNRFLHCYLLNARSIVNKLSELHHLLYVDNCDMVFITETFLQEYVGNGFLDPSAMFSILRKDRQDGKGGGVCAIIKGDICVTPVLLHDRFCELEIVCFTVDKVLPHIRCFVVYRPPYYDHNAILYLHNLIECIKHYSTGTYVNILLIAPSITLLEKLLHDCKLELIWLDMVFKEIFLYAYWSTS